MKEIEMTIDEITINFGREVAEHCKIMKVGDQDAFYVETYEAIIVRCGIDWTGSKVYFAKGELVLEEALELEGGMEMDMW